MNKEKFKIKMNEVPHIDHLLTQNGLKPHPSNTEGILNMSKPIDVKSSTATGWLGELPDKVPEETC